MKNKLVVLTLILIPRKQKQELKQKKKRFQQSYNKDVSTHFSLIIQNVEI